MPHDQHRIGRRSPLNPSSTPATRTPRQRLRIAFAPALLLALVLGDSERVEAATEHTDWVMGEKPGGMIMIHGRPRGLQSETTDTGYSDEEWTNGCIAVGNQEMDEIWGLVADGTPIRIRE